MPTSEPSRADDERILRAMACREHGQTVQSIADRQGVNASTLRRRLADIARHLDASERGR